MSEDWKIKHRPKTVEDFTGNEDIVEIFVHDMSKKNKKRALLISGPHGIGKTTLARIAAVQYLDGNDFTITEINASDDRGIDAVRELKEKCDVFTPSNRIWILDEVQETTKAFQNAILKLLEEGSDKDFFFLCTTDPGKLLSTIRSRCGKYPLQLPEDIEIKRCLRKICKKEDVKVSPEVTLKILEKAEGHVRDAVGFLQSVAGMDESKAIKYLDKMVGGEASSPKAYDLIQALVYSKGKPKPKLIRGLLKDLKEAGEGAEGLRRFILSSGATELLKGGDVNVAIIMEQFEDPYFDAPTAWPKFILDCFRAVNKFVVEDDIPF